MPNSIEPLFFFCELSFDYSFSFLFGKYIIMLLSFLCLQIAQRDMRKLLVLSELCVLPREPTSLKDVRSPTKVKHIPSWRCNDKFMSARS